MLGMKQLWANRDQQNQNAETADVVIPFFFRVYLHTFMAKTSIILVFMSAKHSLMPSTKGVFCLLQLGLPLELWVQPLSEQWVQSTHSQRALLGVGASTSSCECEGCRKDKIGGVFSVQLFQGEYCSSFVRERCVWRGHFPAWLSFFPDEKQKP